mgnify:CR=1 FL=1
MTERPQSIAAWRGMLLAPDPKRANGGLGLRLALVRTLGRKRSQAPATPLAAGKDAPDVRVPDKEATLVPLPPDAPQPQGQLLDFIDALKSRRSAAQARSKGRGGAGRRPAQGSKNQRAGSRRPHPPLDPNVFSDLGGCPTGCTHPPAPQRAIKKEVYPAKRPRWRRRGTAGIGKGRRARRWGLPSRRWRSLIYSLSRAPDCLGGGQLSKSLAAL